jgi:hypothetical protein
MVKLLFSHWSFLLLLGRPTPRILLGRLRLGESWFKASPGKEFMKPHLKQQMQCSATVILVTWEAEIRRIIVSDQSGQKRLPVSISTE